MVNLKDEDVDIMQQYHEDILNTCLVSTSELKSTRTKLIATTPLEFEGFMMMLKRFTRLLFALFFFFMPTIQTGVYHHQSDQGILSKFYSGTTSKHKNNYHLDSTPTGADICAGKDGGSCKDILGNSPT